MTAAAPRAPFVRWFVIGAVIPAVFVYLDSLLLGRLQDRPRLYLLPTLVLYVVQVGTLGVLCGKLIDRPVLRWIIYAWCWLLTDIQLAFFASVPRNHLFGYYDPHGNLLVDSMFAAQLGLITIWAVLGRTWWGWRLPIAAVAMAVLGTAFRAAEPFVLQTIAVAGLCGLMRWKRFRLMLPEELQDDPVLAEYKRQRLSGMPPDSLEVTPVPLAVALAADVTDSTTSKSREHRLRSAQFGIRHVLVWTTSLAVMLGAARALDLMSLRALRNVVGGEWLPFITSGLLAAIVLLVAMWAALGAGRTWFRWLMLTLFSIGGGICAALLHEWGRSLREWVRYFIQSPSTQVLAGLWREGGAYIVQYALAASLLFATLLIFRTLGYRLMQLPKPVAAEMRERES